MEPIANLVDLMNRLDLSEGLVVSIPKLRAVANAAGLNDADFDEQIRDLVDAAVIELHRHDERALPPQGCVWLERVPYSGLHRLRPKGTKSSRQTEDGEC